MIPNWMNQVKWTLLNVRSMFLWSPYFICQSIITSVCKVTIQPTLILPLNRFRRTKWKKQNPGLDVNCGTLPSPPGGPCPFPYPSLFQSSPSEVGFYGAAVAAAQVKISFCSLDHSYRRDYWWVTLHRNELEQLSPMWTILLQYLFFYKHFSVTLLFKTIYLESDTKTYFVFPNLICRPVFPSSVPVLALTIIRARRRQWQKWQDRSTHPQHPIW